MRRLLIAVPLALLTACGGSPAPKAAPPSDAAQLKYARCMRDHGVNMPDDPKKLPAGGLEIPDRAMEACERFSPPGKKIDMKDPKIRDHFARFARCMRANGYDMPDNAPPDIHLRDPRKWEEAYKKCDRILAEGK